MSTTIEATTESTVVVSATTFRAWRLWLSANMHDRTDWRRAVGASLLYHALGCCAGAALNAVIEEWRQKQRKTNGAWDPMPVGAVEVCQFNPNYSAVWFDNEAFTGDTVELAHDRYGDDPDEVVEKVVAMTGIASE